MGRSGTNYSMGSEFFSFNSSAMYDFIMQKFNFS